MRRWRLACPRRAGELDLVFPNGAGNVENHANLANRGLYDAQRKIGMVDLKGSPLFGVHSLRHFFASVMIGSAAIVIAWIELFRRVCL